MAKFTRSLLNADEKDVHTRKNRSMEKVDAQAAPVQPAPETLLQSPGSMLQTMRQDAVLRMQQTHGNNYVRRMLQARAAQSTQTQGGEGLEEDNPNVPIGAEIQRDGDGSTGSGSAAPAPSSATLSVTTKQAPADSGCGGYSAKRQWSITGGGDSTNGFVVQKVVFDTRQLKCDDGADDTLPGTATYWEAWQVRGGKVFVGTSTTPHSADTFAYPSRANHKGRNIEKGSAKYIDGYTDPLSWGHDAPEAQALPSTTTQPAGWSDSGTIACSITETFDCCDGKNEKKLETSGF